jgi:hypothetical protein
MPANSRGKMDRLTRYCCLVRFTISRSEVSAWQLCKRPAEYCAGTERCSAPRFAASRHFSTRWFERMWTTLALPPILEQDLMNGQHRNPTGDPNYFTTAFFHRPEELREEVVDAGFSAIDLIGVEGPAWLATDFDTRWADPGRREQLLDLTRKVEHEAALTCVSPHLLIVGRKQ